MNITAADTEIWFHPHHNVTVSELRSLLENRVITATPRAGIRDARHPKGYAPNQRTMLRLFDSAQQEQYAVPIRITALVIRSLSQISNADLKGCGPRFRGWGDVFFVLSFFEKRWLAENEDITIVHFVYL